MQRSTAGAGDVVMPVLFLMPLTSAHVRSCIFPSAMFVSDSSVAHLFVHRHTLVQSSPNNAQRLSAVECW